MALDTDLGHSLEDLRLSLTETVAYVSSRSHETPATSLRGPETCPPYFWDRKSTVDWVRQQRQFELGSPSPEPASYLQDGRLLIFLPNDSLFDGAARVATHGFFDDHNIPPWDTWVAYLYESDQLQYLVSWIPPDLVSMVNHGIDVNPEGCILWFDELESPVADKLREEGLVRERR